MMSVPDPTEEGSHHKISSTRPVISKKDPSFIFINQSCEFSPYCILSSLQGSDAVVGGVASAVDDNGEDDGGGRRHHATTNPVMKTMSTMAAVADDDGVDGQRRR